MTVDLLAFVAVDAGFHPVGVIGGGFAFFYKNKKGGNPIFQHTKKKESSLN